MKEKYLRPSLVNAEILEFEGAFPLLVGVGVGAALLGAAKVATAVGHAAVVATAVKAIPMPRPYSGLKNFQHLKFE